MESGDKKTVREMAAEMMRNSTIVDLKLAAINNKLQIINEFFCFKQVIDEIKSLRLEDDESIDTVLQWIEVLLQYGVDTLEEGEERDYRLTIFSLYFNFSGGVNSQYDTTEGVLSELEKHRGDRAFANEVIKVLLGKVELLQKVFREKRHEVINLREDRAELMEEKRKYEEMKQKDPDK